MLTVPGLISGDSRTAPVRPPPGPVLPGSETLGWSGAEARGLAAAAGRVAALVEGDHDQAAVFIAGAAMMAGTHRARNALAWASPPGAPVTYGVS